MTHTPESLTEKLEAGHHGTDANYWKARYVLLKSRLADSQTVDERGLYDLVQRLKMEMHPAKLDTGDITGRMMDLLRPYVRQPTEEQRKPPIPFPYGKRAQPAPRHIKDEV